MTPTKKRPGRPSAASLAASAMARKRWAGKTPEEISAHMRMMGKARGADLAAEADQRRIEAATDPRPARRKRS